MKASKAWYVAGLVLVAGFSSASCGKDEASGNPGAGGDVIEGGSGGSGGTRNLGGSSGSGGSGAPVGATKLGRGCIDDADCDDTTAPGLDCITASETVLGNGAPPGGLCTAECASDDECTAFGAGARCYPFEENAETGYCVEGCSFGAPGIGEIKCHNRDEFACNPALLSPTPRCAPRSKTVSPANFASMARAGWYSLPVCRRVAGTSTAKMACTATSHSSAACA